MTLSQVAAPQREGVEGCSSICYLVSGIAICTFAVGLVAAEGTTIGLVLALGADDNTSRNLCSAVLNQDTKQKLFHFEAPEESKDTSRLQGKPG